MSSFGLWSLIGLEGVYLFRAAYNHILVGVTIAQLEIIVYLLTGFVVFLACALIFVMVMVLRMFRNHWTRS